MLPTTERTFDTLAEIACDISLAKVNRWKSEVPGRRAIGFFPVYAPAEIIHAAGMLPVGLNGAGDRLDLQYADARFGSFICSIVKSTLEMGMTSILEPLDGLLFSSICDSARNLCFVMKRNFPQMYIDFLHLPQNPASPAALDFLRGEYERLQRSLEDLGTQSVTRDALRHSIALFNRNRALIRELYRLRAEAPHLLRTWELYSVLRAGNFVPVETHNEWLAETIKEVRSRTAKPRDSIRIIVEGSFCEQPPLELIRLVEEAGCYVVDDDFILGRRWFSCDVAVEEDPLRALAAAYLNSSVCSSVRHDSRRPRHKELVTRARKLNAGAVLLLVAKFCEPAYFDYVLFKREMEATSIPHLLLEFEEKMFTFERLRTEVETFVESLQFD